MSHTYAAELDDEHAGIEFNHELLGALRGRDLEPEITEKWASGTIKPGDDDTVHIVAVVEHLTEAIENVDLVNADTRETHICSCPGFYFHYYDSDIGAKTGDCKHVTRVKAQRRTELPEEQATLGQ